MKRPRFYPFLTAAALALTQTSLLVPAARAAEQPMTLGYVGNSLSGVKQQHLNTCLAATLARKDFKIVNITIPGASLPFILQQAGTSALDKTPCDVLSLQIFNGDNPADIAKAGAQFLAAARKANPAVRPYVYQVWPTQDAWFANPEYRSLPFAEKVADLINEAQPAAAGQVPVGVIPVGAIVREIADMADANLVPGVPTRSDLFRDGIHLSNLGCYLVACAHFATCYREDPKDYPVVLKEPSGVPVYDFPVAATAIIKRVVWEVLQAYPRAGLGAQVGLRPGPPPPAVVGLPFHHAFEALDGKPPFRWEARNLPAGLALSTTGVLEGKPAATGAFPFELVVTDSAGRSARRSITLAVSENTPPRLAPKLALPDAHVGSAYSYVIPAEGGVGGRSWSIPKRAGAPGLALSSNGAFYGSPTQPGDYTINVLVTDRAPGKPNTAESTLTLPVRPPRPETYLAPEVAAPPSLDGAPDATGYGPWSAIKNSARSKGAPTGEFAACWDKQNLYLIVRASSAADQHAPLVVFMDGMHNAESIYNDDDRQFLIGPDGKVGEKGTRGDGLKVKTASAADKRVWEVVIPWKNLRLPASVFIRPGKSIGFDLGLPAGASPDSGPLVTWRAPERALEDTSVFGDLLLVNAEGKLPEAPAKKGK